MDDKEMIIEVDENTAEIDKQKNVLEEYQSQIESNDIHFEHVDWVYSDSSCCC